VPRVPHSSQRSKIRDLYDLSEIARRPLQKELMRSLAVLKLWKAEVRGWIYLFQAFVTNLPAAMVLAVFAYNLCILFQRHLGWLDRVTAATLRFRLFSTGGIISRRRRPHHHPPRGARRTKGLVANAFRKTPQPLAQLQFILPDLATARRTIRKSTSYSE